MNQNLITQNCLLKIPSLMKLVLAFLKLFKNRQKKMESKAKKFYNS